MQFWDTGNGLENIVFAKAGEDLQREHTTVAIGLAEKQEKRSNNYPYRHDLP